MERKQTLLKILCILVMATIIGFFLLFYNNNQINKSDAQAFDSESNSEKPTIPTNPSLPNNNENNYSILPRNSKDFNGNNIINIGGRNNDILLKQFNIKNEIILLVKTNSNSFDFNTEQEMLAVAILDENLSLTKTFTLSKTENKKYLDCCIFNDGLAIIMQSEKNCELLYFDNNYNLKNTLVFERFDSCKLIDNLTHLKLLSSVNDRISFRIITSDFFISNYTHTTSDFIGVFDSFYKLKNKDIFVYKNNENFAIYECKIVNQNNEIYYLIDRISIIKGVLYNNCIKNDKNYLIYFNYVFNNKLNILSLDIRSSLVKNIGSEIITNNSVLLPLNVGFLLHNFVDNTLLVLDDNICVILSNIARISTDEKMLYYYFDRSLNNYYFISSNDKNNNISLYVLDSFVNFKKLITIPKISGKITLKKHNDNLYLFATNNNNISIFDSCFGGSDVYVIKVKITI